MSLPPPLHPARITFVLPALHSGGAERVLITLMNGLDRARFAPTLIVLRNEGELSSLIDPAIPIHQLNTHGSIDSIIPLIRALKNSDPQIVVATMLRTNLLTMLAKPFLPRTIFILREAIMPSFFLSQRRHAWMFKFLYRAIYPFADLIISPAQRIIDEFSTIIGLKTHKHRVLPNPVDVEKIRGYTVSPLPQDTINFICAGRLHAQKGYDALLAALPSLPAGMAWTLTIYGQGPEEAALRAQIEQLDCVHKVKLAGLATEPWPKMAAADALLLPSRWEGLPNVALESLAAGTPVIALKSAGGIDEIAQAALPGAVRVVDGMPAFIDAMRSVQKNMAPLPRASLLPHSFKKAQVQSAFTALLDGALQHD